MPQTAIEFLSQSHRRYMRGCSLANHPTEVLVTSGLLDAYEAELVIDERFVQVVNDQIIPMFKGARVLVGAARPNWEVIEWRGWPQEYRRNYILEFFDDLKKESEVFDVDFS